MTEKNCLECGKAVLGRRDKKFCDTQCRNDFNNRESNTATPYMRKVNGILRKNKKILAKLNNKEKARYPKERLLEEGLNFTYVSSYYKTKEGKMYYFCYEQGYLELDNDWYLLVENKKL